MKTEARHQGERKKKKRSTISKSKSRKRRKKRGEREGEREETAKLKSGGMEASSFFVPIFLVENKLKDSGSSGNPERALRCVPREATNDVEIVEWNVQDNALRDPADHLFSRMENVPSKDFRHRLFAADLVTQRLYLEL